MAAEISIIANITVFKAAIMSSQVGRSILPGTTFNMSGNVYTENTILVSTSAGAIGLGAVSVPGWFWFRNMDTNNNIGIRNGAGNANFLVLTPSSIAMGILDPACVPYAIATTAPCYLEYLIASQ